MARISNRVTYPQDANLQNGDYLLGTDVEGGAVATRTYSLESLRSFIETGIDVRRDSGAFHLPVVSIDGQRVEQSQLRQFVARTTTTDTMFSSVTSTSNDHIQLDADLLNDGVDGLTIQIYDYKQAFYLPSYTGRTYSITTSEGTFVGTIGTYINPTGLGTDGAITVNNINGRTGVHTVHRFRLTETPGTTQPVRSPQIIQNITIGSGLEYLAIALEADLETRAIRVDGDADINGNTDISGNAAVGGTFGVTGNTTLGGNLQVDGTSQFNNTVDVGMDGGTPVRVNIHGDMHFNDSQGGIIFGDPDPSVTLTTDGDNLTWGGTGNINVANDVTHLPGSDITLNQGNLSLLDGNLSVTGTTTLNADQSTDTVTVQNVDFIRRVSADGQTELDNLEVVKVNSPVAFARTRTQVEGGVANTIFVGNTRYQLPSPSSSVAQIIPGLTEELVGPPSEIMTGTFFDGIDRGTFAEFTRLATNSMLTTPLTIPAGATRVTNTDATDDTELITDFNEVRANERLFFVESTSTFDFTSASQGDTVTGRVYEVTNYTPLSSAVNPGLLEFTLVGAGTLTVSSATFNVSSTNFNVTTPNLNLTALEQAPAGASTFLFIDDTNGRVTQNSLQAVAGAQAQQTIQDGTDTPPVLSSIDYQGNHNVSNVGGALTIDLSGRYNSSTIASEMTSDFSAVAFGAYLLGGISANPTGQAYAATVTLPSGNASDSIKFVNLSTVGMGGASQSSGTWRIIPAAGERIMKLPADQNLILNDPGANFELVYSSADIGWVLIGTN